MHHATPAEGAQRLELLDALRGFALAGVLLVNLRDLSLFGFLTEEARAELPTAGWDHFLAILIAAFVEKKALTIFTLLFGIGFAMQAERAESEHGMQYYIRRLLILLAIGILHGLFWSGDILRFYALMGLLLVPMRRMNSGAVLIVGLFISLVPWGFVQSIAGPLDSGALPQDVMVMWAFAAFSSPSLPRMLQANFSYDLWLRVVQWSLPLAIFGRFVLGAVIGRSAVLRDPRAHSKFWKRLFIFTLPVGAGLRGRLRVAVPACAVASLAEFAGACRPNGADELHISNVRRLGAILRHRSWDRTSFRPCRCISLFSPDLQRASCR